MGWHYKMRRTTDHRVNFHVDRLTHLGDLAFGIKKTSAVKHLKSAAETTVSGRANNNEQVN